MFVTIAERIIVFTKLFRAIASAMRSADDDTANDEPANPPRVASDNGPAAAIEPPRADREQAA